MKLLLFSFTFCFLLFRWLVFAQPFFQGDPRVLEVGGYPNPASWGVEQPYVGSVHPLKIVSATGGVNLVADWCIFPDCLHLIYLIYLCFATKGVPRVENMGEPQVRILNI